jgi:VWFA-related protein
VIVRPAVIAALTLSTMLSAQTQAPPVFSSKVEVVRVDVLATDKGQPLLGLTAADFEVFDNGVPQQVEFVSYDQIPLNVVLALDMSDSVAGDRLEHLRAAGASLLTGLKRNDQAALVTFSNRIALGAALTSDLQPLRDALEDVVGAGETSLVDGAYAGLTVGESDPGRALLIVFSDGLDTLSWLSPAAVLETAKRSDVVVYGVTAGRTKSEFLRELTSFSGGRLFEMDKTAKVSATFLSILEEFRRRYLVSYTPRGVSKDGWHRLDVRIKDKRATVKARPGYLAGPG